MKHLLLHLAEEANQEPIDTSLIEYDHNLNLNVLKSTSIPAVIFDNQATETFTKGGFEGTDSDQDVQSKIDIILGTSTQTRAQNESSDNDKNNQLELMLDTRTKTFTNTEASDDDKNFTALQYVVDTRTLTESLEVTDSDK